ncbi:OmpA family protein [Agitococcus lubricus]|uniref:OOP family OmpA-OmpF porin n=1 Tax=Agitococcus lubricus TaxID=1077255 RepID=A0A2T5J477_9GAMM|nr:OmpA family protein [Agitococcus lubricus]PTQ91414.1 OOP family OmpA-OmpF porin [Agitococcus lubricus]
MKLNRIALAVVLAAPMAMSAHAALFSVTPLLGYHAPDEGDSGAYVGLAAGVKLVSSVSVEAEYGKASDAKLFNGNVLISPASWTAGSLSPYVLTGIGQQDLDYTKSGVTMSTTDTVMNLGGGAFYSFSDALALRGELRAIHNSDQSKTDFLVLTGLQYGFGGETKPIQYVPVPEPKTYVPVDTDGDGVVDTNDRCPNTPAGWEVGVDGCPLDSDKDRVPNSIDECPNTPAGMQVGANGCPLDEDKDGVTDANDKCPGTAANVVVDDKGCAKMVTKEVKEAIKEQINIVFDSGKSVIKPEYKGEVAKIADLAKQYSKSFITIEGHTDSSGSPAKNNTLSQDRAKAVMSMLISEYGIDASRLTAIGYGSSKPIADNKTAEGKAKNRRVIAVLTAEKTTTVSKVVTKPVKAKKGKKATKKKAKK